MMVLLEEHAGLCIGPNIKRPRRGRTLKVRRSREGARRFRVNPMMSMEYGSYSSV